MNSKKITRMKSNNHNNKGNIGYLEKNNTNDKSRKQFLKLKILPIFLTNKIREK